VHSGVVGRGILLDGVALLGFNGNLALVLDLGSGATGLSGAPVP